MSLCTIIRTLYCIYDNGVDLLWSVYTGPKDLVSARERCYRDCCGSLVFVPLSEPISLRGYVLAYMCVCVCVRGSERKGLIWDVGWGRTVGYSNLFLLARRSRGTH